jgi:hypothetical protein
MSLNDGTPDTGDGTEAAPSTPATPPGDTFVIDGETLTSDQVREMKKGYLRQADYTKKTQELAAARQALEPLQKFDQFLAANPHVHQAVKAAVAQATAGTPGVQVPNSTTPSAAEALTRDIEELKFLRVNPTVQETDLQDIRQIADAEGCSLSLAHKAWIADKKLPAAYKQGAADAQGKARASVDPSSAAAPAGAKAKGVLDVPKAERGKHAAEYIRNLFAKTG